MAEQTDGRNYHFLPNIPPSLKTFVLPAPHDHFCLLTPPSFPFLTQLRARLKSQLYQNKFNSTGLIWGAGGGDSVFAYKTTFTV